MLRREVRRPQLEWFITIGDKSELAFQSRALVALPLAYNNDDIIDPMREWPRRFRNDEIAGATSYKEIYLSIYSSIYEYI